MIEFIKKKLSKLGCFVLIAILMIATSAIVKWLLERLHFDSHTSEDLAKKSGDFIGQACLVLLLIAGLILMVRQIRAELKARDSKSQPSRPTPPPLPGGALPQFVPLASPGLSPAITVPPKQKSGVGKGCLIVATACLVLTGLGLAVINHLASEYERRPKQPGESELVQAEDFVGAFKDREGAGNTPEAEKLAVEFARQLRIMKQILLSGVNPGWGDLTKGRFLTYCSRTKDSVVFIVQVPGLRSMPDDARLTLEEHAWETAAQLLATESPETRKLAIGLRGGLDYSAILTGEIDSKHPKIGPFKRNPVDTQASLWPYFIPDEKMPSKANQ